MSVTTLYRDLDAGVESRDLTGADTVTLNDSGKVLRLNAAAGAAVTMPAARDGFNCEIMTKTLFATTPWVFTFPTSTVEGHILVAGSVVAASNENTITFVHTADKVGDRIRIESDGTSYFVSGSAETTGAITATVV